MSCCGINNLNAKQSAPNITAQQFASKYRSKHEGKDAFDPINLTSPYSIPLPSHRLWHLPAAQGHRHRVASARPVSYTHLTLPTILLV